MKIFNSICYLHSACWQPRKALFSQILYNFHKFIMDDVNHPVKLVIRPFTVKGQICKRGYFVTKKKQTKKKHYYHVNQLQRANASPAPSKASSNNWLDWIFACCQFPNIEKVFCVTSQIGNQLIQSRLERWIWWFWISFISSLQPN